MTAPPYAEEIWASSLSGHAVIVTGGGSGIGAAVCRTVARAGAAVGVWDIAVDDAQKVAEEIGAAAAPEAIDVSDSRQVNSAVDRFVHRHGRLDAVIHCAGVDDPDT
jgi:3-oxoacyl-[acyl-carrier protein] reductase